MEEAVEDMKQYGASLVQPVAQAAEATRAQGQSVLQQGVGGVGDFLLREIKKDTVPSLEVTYIYIFLDLFKVIFLLCTSFYHGKSPLNHHLEEFVSTFSKHLKQI